MSKTQAAASEASGSATPTPVISEELKQKIADGFVNYIIETIYRGDPIQELVLLQGVFWINKGSLFRDFLSQGISFIGKEKAWLDTLFSEEEWQKIIGGKISGSEEGSYPRAGNLEKSSAEKFLNLYLSCVDSIKVALEKKGDEALAKATTEADLAKSSDPKLTPKERKEHEDLAKEFRKLAASIQNCIATCYDPLCALRNGSSRKIEIDSKPNEEGLPDQNIVITFCHNGQQYVITHNALAHRLSAALEPSQQLMQNSNTGKWKVFKIFSNGSYVGEFESGNMHGKGRSTLDDGSSYDGMWKNGDKMDCEGKLIYTDGSSYMGKCKNGKAHGEGKLTLTDGSSYNGGWKNDKMHGKVVFTCLNGSIETMWFKEGDPSSNGEEFIKSSTPANSVFTTKRKEMTLQELRAETLRIQQGRLP